MINPIIHDDTEEPVNLNDLRIFMKVAQTLSVTETARTLHYVQSNITARIAALESELGTQLFYRSVSGRTRMKLTAAGKTLLPYAESALRTEDNARRAILNVMQGEPTGDLAIASTENAAAVQLPTLFARYYRQFPQVALDLMTGTSRKVFEAVLAREVDCGFVSGAMPHPELEGTTVFTEQLVLVGEVPVPPAIIVLRDGCTHQEVLERWMVASGFANYRVIVRGSIEAILSSASVGMGICIFPRSVVDRSESASSATLVQLPPEEATVPTTLIWRKDVVQTAALLRFREMCLEEAENQHQQKVRG